MILLAAVPLLYPPIPPLTDLIGHMGRYRVELDLASSPSLQQYYRFQWALVGNLGVDLLIVPMAKLFGLELGTKLIVIAIPMLTVAGMLWVAREVHHRLPPTAMFALPFAYGHPLMFGFVNFALSIALAFLAFGLWLRLGRLGKTRLRAALFVPLSLIVFFTHTFGWGVLGLMAFSAEAVRQHDRGRSWWLSGIRAAGHASALALPLVLMLVWRSEATGGVTFDWFNFEAKWTWLVTVLRDRWRWFDLASAVIAPTVVLFALINPRLVLSRNLAFSVLVLSAVFVLLPRVIFGSAYADMRLTPVIFALALLAIRFKGDTDLPTARVLALIALAFMLVRTAATTLSLGLAANDQTAKLAALDHLPIGARVMTVVGGGCGMPWAMPRNDHLGSMVIVRKLGFSNDQWPLAGASLLAVRNHGAGRFAYDPSQKVRPIECAQGDAWPIDWTLRRFPRSEFDYLWLIDPVPFNPANLQGISLVWSGPGSALYRLRTQAWVHNNPRRTGTGRRAASTSPSVRAPTPPPNSAMTGR